MKKETVLEAINLKKIYGKKTVFDNLNFKVYRGDRIALLGPNGCGKTTLVEMICGLRNITEGKIVYKEGETNFFKSLGMQFQSGRYPAGIQVKDLMYFYSQIYNQKIDTKEKKNFEIESLENADLDSLSFGQTKRVELFLLLMAKLRFLILDEITAGMDIAIKFKILNLLQDHLKRNTCEIIYISHNLDEINLLCNRLIVLTEQGIVLDQKIDAKFDVTGTMNKILRKR